MSRQGNNYDNKYYKNPPYGSGNKGPGGNGSFGGGQGGGPVNGGGGQMGGGGPPGGNMNWGMYGGSYAGNRHAGGNRGFNSSQGPTGYGSSGGGQFGTNVRGTANTRGGMGGGGYSRHGEKGADYFVQDEVAGAGSRRIAPPAHSGAPPAHSGQYPYQAPSQIFGQHAPPQAHASMYGSYPGYGGSNYSDYFSNWAGGERFPSRGYGGDKVGGDREERDQEKPNLAQLPKSLSVTRFQGGFQSKEGESGVSNKDVARESVALPDAGEEASEAAKQPVGGCGGGVERAGPPTSPGAPSSFGGNRRKQSTPQKVPTSPGSATLIITQKGLSPPETNSPQHETPFISPKVFQGSKPGSTVGKVSPVVSDKIPGKQEKTSPSPTKPFPSPSKPVLKLNILEKSSDESDALVIDTSSPGASKIVTPASKQLKSPDKMIGKNTGSLEGSKNDKLLLARQSTEGNLADKEDFSDDDIKVKPIVRKKRLGKSDNNKKLDESDSEAEPSIKIKRSPRNEIKMDAANEDSNKKKTSRSPKPSKTPEVSKVDKGFIVPQVKELKESDIASVRRRRSRGEMKEFPCDVNLIPEESNPTKPLIENSETGSSPDKKSEAGGRRRRLSSGTQATKKKIFQQVEEDLEAMFAGLEDSDTEKRTKKKTSSDSASDEPKEKKNPVIKTKQKEEAPEISELKSTSDRRRPGAKPRYTMESEKNDVEPKKEKDEYSFDPEEFESSPKRRKEKLEEKPSSDLEEFEVLPKSKNERKKRGPKQGVKRVPQEQKVTDDIDDLLKETPPKLNRKKPSPRLGSKREKRTFKSSYAELDDDNSVFEESSQHTPDKDVKQKINRPKSSVDQNEKTIEETNKVTSISESTAEVDLKKPDPKIIELTKKRGNDSKLKTKEEITETDSPSTSKRSISRLKSEVKVDTTPEKTRPRRRRSDIVDSLGESPIVEASKEDDDVEKGRDNSRLAVRTGGKSRRNASMKSPSPSVKSPLPSVKSDVKPDDIVSPVSKKEENVSAKLSGEISNVEIMKNEVKLIKIISPKVRTGTPDSSTAKTEAKETRSSGRKRKASVLDNLESPPPFFAPIEDKRDDVPKIRKRRSDNSESSSTTEKKSLPPLEKPHRTSRRARGLPVDPKEAKASEIEPEILSDNIKKILESTIEITDISPMKIETEITDISPMKIETKPSVVEMTDISDVVFKKVEENLIESKDEDAIEVIKEIPSGGFLEKAIQTNKKEAPKNIVDIPLEVPLEMKNVEVVAQKESIDTLSKPPTDPFEKEKDLLESPKTSFAFLHSTLDDSFSEDSPGKSPGKKRGRPFGSKNRSKDEKDFESDKEKKKSIKKEKPFAKLTDTDKENGSKNSSAKTSRRASIEDNSKGKAGGKKKMKKQNEVEMLLEKFKGPFIHINGDFSSPLEVRVINSSLDSLDAPHKPSKSRAICDKEHRAKVSNFGHSSTLSRQYDHKNLDDSWVCVFCNQTTHWKGLGDLFGPYWIPSNLIKTPQKKRPEPEIKASHVEGAKKNKRRRKSSLTEEKLNEPCLPISGNNSSDVSEIWFHEDCLCWVPCVYLVGSKIVGLEEAVDQTSETICCSCEYRGASVGCCSAGCRQTAHVGCAQQEGWSLNIDTFIATCTRHA